MPKTPTTVHIAIALDPIEEHPSMRPLIEARQALTRQQHHVQQEILTVRERYRQVTTEPPQLVELLRHQQEFRQHERALDARIQEAREAVQQENKQALAPQAQEALTALVQAMDALAQAEATVRAVMREGRSLAGATLVPLGVLDAHLPNRRKLAQRTLDRFRTMRTPTQDA